MDLSSIGKLSDTNIEKGHCEWASCKKKEKKKKKKREKLEKTGQSKGSRI